MELPVFGLERIEFSFEFPSASDFIGWILRYLALSRPEPIAYHLFKDELLFANLSDAIVEFLASARLVRHIDFRF
jgi:hypothetical protein